MKARKFVPFLLWVILVPVVSYGGDPTATQKRLFCARVFDMLTEYEQASRFNMESDIDDMVRLFGGRMDAQVYMDLNDSPDFGRSVSLKEYIDYIVDNQYHVESRIREVCKGEIRQEENILILPVSMRKKATYFDNNDRLFSLEFYFKAPLYLTLEFYYDLRTGDCYINSISGEIDSPRAPLPREYTIILRHDRADWLKSRYDSLLVKKNTEDEFDPYGQYFIAGDVKDFKSFDPDLRIGVVSLPKALPARYDMIRFKYTPINWRARLNAAFSPMAYAVRSEDGVKGGSIAFEPTLQLGYSIPMGVFKLTPYIGCGMSVSCLFLYRKKYSFAYPQSFGTEEDGLRSYNIRKASQTFGFFDWVFPVVVDGEYRINENMLVHGYAGVKYYMNRSTGQLKQYTVVGTVNGEPLNTVTDAYIVPADFHRNKDDVVVSFGADWDLNLLDNRLFLSCGVAYDQAFNPSYAGGSGSYLNPEEGIYPLVFDSRTGAETAYSPLYGSISVTRSSLWLRAGVIAKF